MSCECYKIGGPWITFDPDCPAHGYQAQREAEEREREESERNNQIADLQAQITALRAELEALKKG